MDETGLKQTDTHVTDIKTSQQRRGEYSLCEGKSGGSVNGPNLHGTDGAPTGVDTKTAMSEDNQLKTTAQIRDEISSPESEKAF